MGPYGYFKMKSYGAMATFGPGNKDSPVPYCHKYCTVPNPSRAVLLPHHLVPAKFPSNSIVMFRLRFSMEIHLCNSDNPQLTILD